MQLALIIVQKNKNCTTEISHPSHSIESNDEDADIIRLS